jgi:acyl dehydratase
LPVLYGYAQRAQLAVMVGPGFPYRVPGLIHLSNTQQLLNGPAPGPFTLEVKTTREVTLEREAICFEVDFAQDQVFATCRSVYLARKLASRKSEPEALEPLPHQAEWQLPADEGRRYAAASGDYNPVHLSPWLARLFGYPRALAHGMDTAGRVVAALEREVRKPITRLEIAFKRPILLPARVQVEWDDQGRYRVVSGDGNTLHATGIGSA